jgi:membrane protease YdiL (CAAX protease family)
VTSLDAPVLPDAPVETPPARPPEVWKFWGTALWGVFVFAALFVGQLTVVGYLVFAKGVPLDFSVITTVLGSGTTISLSVLFGLPAVCAAIWLATHLARMPFADYLALHATSWKNYLFGAVALAVLIFGWDLFSRAIGRDVAPGFMVEVLRSARADGALWLLLLAFCVGAPMTEEFFVRGFLYRGWSESFLRPWGAIALSSAVWTLMHLQYDWFFLGEVFSIGLLLGYLRRRFASTWLTVFVHGLNNLAATLQSIWLAGHS